MARKPDPAPTAPKPQPAPPKPQFQTFPLDLAGNDTAHFGGAAANPLSPSYDPGNPAGSAASTPSSDAAAPPPDTIANDWYKAFFGQYGVPPDVQSQLINILKQYAADPSTGQALATQYLRTTPWYQTTFPGFSQGVQNGLYTDETGYRSYVNAVNSVYNQYLGRHVSGDEVSQLLAEGANPSTLANRFQGQAYIQANKPDIQYLAGAYGENGRLSSDQLTALGNEQAGIDTPLGQLQQKILAKAQQVHDKLFSGNLATPSLSIGPNGLSSPSLAGGKQTPDVGV